MNDRRYIAIHEAGHAVVGRAVTLPCGEATIVPSDPLGSSGNAIVATADMAWREWELREKFRDYASACRARILAAMAGHEAEAVILCSAECCDEVDRAISAAEMTDLGIPDGREAAVEARLRQATRQLVRRHRADIERVAAALLERETLTGPEIDAMLPPGFMARPVTWALAPADSPATHDTI